MELTEAAVVVFLIWVVWNQAKRLSEYHIEYIDARHTVYRQNINALEHKIEELTEELEELKEKNGIE